MASESCFLTDPFLQAPTPDSVRVVWFTEFPGQTHAVAWGAELSQSVLATTTQLTCVREDQATHLGQRPVQRSIWRHEAIVTGLPRGQRQPYRVISWDDAARPLTSATFSLSPSPPPGTPLRILLTSDHQLKPMVAANLQKVVETVGRVDAVFFAGDLVNIPDRASEWFDRTEANAFFPTLQGRTHSRLHGQIYHGGELIQHAPLFTALGNHEVMGRWSDTTSLADQFNDTYPRLAALRLNPDLTLDQLKAQSFNTDTYEELFSLPESSTGGKRYYATTLGDVRLVVLYVTCMWRSPRLDPTVQGKYQERQADLATPEHWGYGQLVFEPIARGTLQYEWLQQELASEAYQRAKYKVVMLHHPIHTLGENCLPAYTDPVQRMEQDGAGRVQAIAYDYPPQQDYLVRDVLPLLQAAQVQLVLYGHSHLWNRFCDASGIHFLETSNVGNSYGLESSLRQVGQSSPTALTSVHGLPAVVPTIAPCMDSLGQPLPYLASNTLTAFSILDTGTGTVDSYYFDTDKPDSEAVLFDRFSLVAGVANASV